MGSYTILGGFENPGRGRQAKKFNNNCSENSRSQIVFRTDIFQKLSLGAHDLSANNQQQNFNRLTDLTCCWIN